MSAAETARMIVVMVIVGAAVAAALMGVSLWRQIAEHRQIKQMRLPPPARPGTFNRASSTGGTPTGGTE